MATQNNIGKTLYIADELPTTNDKTGFEALSWVQVKGVQVLPQLGVTGANIDVPDLQSGFTAGVKGAMSGNESTATFRRVDNDPGQEDVEEIANSPEGLCSIKIVRGSGTNQAPMPGDPVQYAQGYMNAYLEIQGDTTTHEGFTVTFKQNDFTVNDVEPGT